MILAYAGYVKDESSCQIVEDGVANKHIGEGNGAFFETGASCQFDLKTTC
jgi:hypothetical protein